MPWTVVVLRAKVTSSADMSGVITPTRSSSPIRLSSVSTSGLLMTRDEMRPDVIRVEKQDEHPRA